MKIKFFFLLILIFVNEVFNIPENRKQLQYRIIKNTLKDLNTKKIRKIIDFLPFTREHELEKSEIKKLIYQLETKNINTLVILTTFSLVDSKDNMIRFNDNEQNLFSLNLSRLNTAESLIILYSNKNKYFRIISNPSVMLYLNKQVSDNSLMNKLKENPYNYIHMLLDGLYKLLLPKDYSGTINYDIPIKSLFIIPVVILLCVGKCCFTKKARKERKFKLLKEKIQKLIIDLNKFNSEALKEKSCVICFKDFTENDADISQNTNEDIALLVRMSKEMDKQLIVGLRCEHYFHYNCILIWFKKKKNCPTCRQDVSDYIVI
jgi:hypothetical protein